MLKIGTQWTKTAGEDSNMALSTDGKEMAIQQEKEEETSEMELWIRGGDTKNGDIVERNKWTRLVRRVNPNVKEMATPEREEE